MARKTARQLTCACLLGSTLLLTIQPAWSKDLVVAQIGALSAKPVPEVVQLGQGMQALFAAVNARGGVNGNRVDFFQLDDALDPNRFVQRFHEALERKPLALLSPFGSPSVQRMLSEKLLDSADIVVINAVPGAEAFREPGHPKLFHVRAGDGQQIAKVTQHVRTLGLERMGMLFVDAPGGHSGLKAAQIAAKKIGALEVTGFKASLAPDSVAAAAQALVRAKMQSALVLGPPSFMAEAVGALRQVGGSFPVFALSYIGPEELTQLVGSGAARGTGIAQAFPNPMGARSPLQREFNAAMRKAFPELQLYTSFHMEGYLCAKLFVEAAKRMEKPTPTELARVLKSAGEMDFGGFRLDFSQGSAGSRFVDIGVVDYRGHLNY